MTHTEIAQQLRELHENIILIYAFNATGKTRVSVEYKNITKDPESGAHAGVYYNAYSEDLFIWNNDEEHDNANISLQVINSSLNQFHSFLTTELIEEKLAPYLPKYKFELNIHDDSEKGVESITFFLEDNRTPIKISRGEERIFIWCFFLALFEVDGWANQQDAHIFIDDPVSSLDDHNIFISAQSIFNLIEANYLKKRIIISTHHIGLFSILFNWLKKGDKSGTFDKLTKPYILSNRSGELVLRSDNSEVFLFHLHLLQILKTAVDERLYLFHFVLLRQVLENIASFLGTGRIGFVLSEIGITDVNVTMDRINSLSHQNAYRFQFNEMSETEETIFKEVFNKLLSKYNFKLQ